jgi:hypothetical protein
MELMLAFNKQVNASIVDHRLLPVSVRNWRWISEKLPRFLVAVSMPSRVTKPAKPNRHWPW